jgi:hypothetical protein
MRMPDLDFHVAKAEIVPYAASPQLAFKVRISEAPGKEAAAQIQGVSLRCQIRLEPGRRRYSPSEQEKLLELYGEPKRWGQTVRSTLWMNVSVVVPPFVKETVIDLPVPCTYDFNIATTKYFHALEDGEIPICLLFSGTIFYAGDEGLQVEQISWEKETTFRLDVQIWKQMMEVYYPNTAWLCLRRDLFDRLYRFKTGRGLPSWEQAIDLLLDGAEEEVRS